MRAMRKAKETLVTMQPADIPRHLEETHPLAPQPRSGENGGQAVPIRMGMASGAHSLNGYRGTPVLATLPVVPDFNRTPALSKREDAHVLPGAEGD